MRAYVLKILFLALISVFAATYYVLNLYAPIDADYWVRDITIIKRYLCRKITTPKIIVLGGSSVLFGFDAALMEKELKMPTVNFGLHAALRMEYLIDIAQTETKPGDILILPLEAEYYGASVESWNSLQLRNALAWDLPTLQKEPLWRKLKIYSKAFTPEMLREIIDAKRKALTGQQTKQNLIKPPAIVVEEFEKRINDPEYKADHYRYADIDGHGVPPYTDKSTFTGKSQEWENPSYVDAYSRKLLEGLIKEMKAKNVTVYFANCPYILDGLPHENYEKGEREFNATIREMGSEVIDTRAEVRFPREMLFDSVYHLNAKGRELRTKVLIEALRPRIAALKTSAQH